MTNYIDIMPNDILELIYFKKHKMEIEECNKMVKSFDKIDPENGLGEYCIIKPLYLKYYEWFKNIKTIYELVNCKQQLFNYFGECGDRIYFQIINDKEGTISFNENPDYDFYIYIYQDSFFGVTGEDDYTFDKSNIMKNMRRSGFFDKF